MIWNLEEKLFYQLSKHCGEDGAAKFLNDFSSSESLQQRAEGGFGTSQKLIHIC